MSSQYDMENVLEVFDARTERLLECITIPPSHKRELIVLMGWKDPEDEQWGWDLSQHQLMVIGEWVGRELRNPEWIVQLVGE